MHKFPSIYYNYFSEPLVTVPIAMRAIRLAYKSRAIRFYKDAEEVAPPQIDDSKIISLTGYINMLRDILGNESGFIINGFQSFSTEVNDRCMKFISKLGYDSNVNKVVLIDFFAGCYKRSFFKLHKDEMDIYGSSVLGKKTYLCWPFEYFSSNSSSGDPTKACHPKNWIEFESKIDRATALRSESNLDLFLWPASCWHIAIGGSDVHASINIGIQET